MGTTITPTASATSLFRAATMVSPTDPGIDWGVGWAIRSSCPVGQIWTCEDGDTPDEGPERSEFKPDPGEITSRRFRPFTILQVEGCAAGTSRTPTDQREAELTAGQRLTTYTEGWVGRALFDGVREYDQGIRDLTSSIGNFGTLGAAITALLEEWADEDRFERPILHLPWSAATTTDPIVQLRDLVDVVYNPGYPTNHVALTGRVEISVREPDMVPTNDGSESLQERRTNQTLFIKERLAVYRFDECLAARATWGGS